MSNADEMRALLNKLFEAADEVADEVCPKCECSPCECEEMETNESVEETNEEAAQLTEESMSLSARLIKEFKANPEIPDMTQAFDVEHPEPKPADDKNEMGLRSTIGSVNIDDDMDKMSEKPGVVPGLYGIRQQKGLK
jgi:hypothetical protein